MKTPFLKRLYQFMNKHHWVHIADQWTTEEQKEMRDYLNRKIPNDILGGKL